MEPPTNDPIIHRSAPCVDATVAPSPSAEAPYSQGGGPPPPGCDDQGTLTPVAATYTPVASSSLHHVQANTSQAPPELTFPARAPRLPLRVGISWRKGEKLEAMDRTNTWYPSKIVDVVEASKLVKIHFEGWNKRLDEWMAMDSEKIRPSTRHSERKEKIKQRRVHPHPIYREGERVLAKWTDCKKYPAKVNRQNEDGSYEVIFFDGLTRTVTANNMLPMPEDGPIWLPPIEKSPQKNLLKSPQKVSSPLVPKSKIAFKHIKVNLPNSVSKSRGRPLGSMGRKFSPSKHMKQASIRLSPLKAHSQALSPGQLARARVMKSLSFSKASTSTVTAPAVAPTDPSLDAAPAEEGSSTEEELTEEEPALKFPKRSVDVKRGRGRPPLSAETSPSRPGDVPLVCADALPLSPKQGSSQASESYTYYTGDPPIKMRFTVKDEKVEVQDTHPSALNNAAYWAVRAEHKEKTKKKKKYKVGSGLDMKKRKRSRFKSHGGEMGEPPAKKRAPALGVSQRSQSEDPACPLTPVPYGYAYEYFAPKKAFVVQEDPCPFKCPTCGKGFRKQKVLTDHVRHYHPENAPLPPPTPHTTPHATPPSTHHSPSLPSPLPPLGMPLSPSPLATQVQRKRRRKTNSVCSTDSDISVSSRGGKSSAKRRRNDSEISVTAASPDLGGHDLRGHDLRGHDLRGHDLRGHDLWQASSSSVEVAATEMKEEEKEEEGDGDGEEGEEQADGDVVNCVCGSRETGGLMIQCDVCMCWQHFTCVDSTGAGQPPANYVCTVCEDTPGVRDSSKFLYDLGWERRGELPGFSFTPEEGGLKALAVSVNSVLGSLQGLKSVLHSTRRHIKISKEEDDPEFQLWQTDWDHWTKPEEDVLTPHSTDHAPSPTPSTFLFPAQPSTSSQSLNTDTGPTSSSQSLNTDTGFYLSSQSLNNDTGPSPSLHSLNTDLGSTSSSHSFSHEAIHAASSQSLTSASTSSTSTQSATESSQPQGVTKQLTVSASAAPEVISADSLSPPLTSPAPHPTPTSLRPSAHRLPSIQGRASGLVRDLFPGPGGDATAPLVSPSIPKSDDILLKSSQVGEDTQQKRNHQSKIPQTQQEQPVSEASSHIKDSSGVSENVVNGKHNQPQEPTYSAPQDVNANADTEGDESPYLEVLGDSMNNGYNDDDNDTDTAEESAEAYKHCEHNLLVHVNTVHGDIEQQLEELEQHIIELESAEHSAHSATLSEDNVLNDVPALKKSLTRLSHSLSKIHRLSL